MEENEYAKRVKEQRQPLSENNGTKREYVQFQKENKNEVSLNGNRGLMI